MFLQRIKEIVLNRGERKTDWITYEVDAETNRDLKEMKRISRQPIYLIVSDAIKAWVRGKLNIDNTILTGNQMRQLKVKINDSLKKKFDKKIEKEGRVKYITLGLIIKTYIENEYKDEWGGMKTGKLLNEWMRYIDRFRRKF